MFIPQSLSVNMADSTGVEAVPFSMGALEVKLGFLVTLLLLTFISGLVPFYILRRPGIMGPSGTHRKTLSLISCFSGGVFLATCLLDLVPNYLSSINESLIMLNVTLQFPLQEFILAMGFFLILALEQIVLSYPDSFASSEDKHALLDGHSSSPVSQLWRPDLPHIHVDVNSHSAVRALVLVLSLSLQSVFQGVAVGQQPEGGKVLETCLALLLHKCLISFSMTLKLGQGRMRPRAVLGCLLFFCFMLPLGIGLGMAPTQVVAAVHELSFSVIEGIGTGAFIYLTFLEIVPHEISSPEHRIPKLIVLLLGFSFISGILFIKI
ncbi:zinc transporter ZIP1 isoform 2-T2 [Discoglossus pictus]